MQSPRVHITVKYSGGRPYLTYTYNLRKQEQVNRLVDVDESVREQARSSIKELERRANCKVLFDAELDELVADTLEEACR
jgi:hypothetical protein